MLNVIMPAAGLGSRTREHYGVIKPLTLVSGKSLITWTIENVWCKDANFIFVVQREHCKEFGLDQHIEEICDRLGNTCNIVQLDGQTEGAACSILKAKQFIDNDIPLLSVNVDQYCKGFSTEVFMRQMLIDNADGAILVFDETNPKWSFVRTNGLGVVCKVAEKKPISNLATLGYYGFRKGSDFCKYAQNMIVDNFRVNGEFYTCPVYDWMIQDSKIIRAYYTNQAFGTGTVPDIENFKKVVESWES